jgi:hypothetical protein
MGFIIGRKDGIGVRIHEYPSDIIKICLVTCIRPYQSLPFWTEVEVEYRGSDSSAWTAMNHKVNSQLESREPRSRTWVLWKLKSHIEWQNSWTSRLQYQTRYHWTPPNRVSTKELAKTQSLIQLSPEFHFFLRTRTICRRACNRG